MLFIRRNTFNPDVTYICEPRAGWTKEQSSNSDKIYRNDQSLVTAEQRGLLVEVLE